MSADAFGLFFALEIGPAPRERTNRGGSHADQEVVVIVLIDEAFLVVGGVEGRTHVVYQE